MQCKVTLRKILAGHGDVWHGFIDIVLTESHGVADKGTKRRPDKNKSMLSWVFFTEKNNF